MSDHDTAARLKGFLAAHAERAITVPDGHVLATGYSAERAAQALGTFVPDKPTGVFVHSTFSLDGVMRRHRALASAADPVRFGCFDRDPFGSYLPGNIAMIEQDASAMLDSVFAVIGKAGAPTEPSLVPCRLHAFAAGA